MQIYLLGIISQILVYKKHDYVQACKNENKKILVKGGLAVYQRKYWPPFLAG